MFLYLRVIACMLACSLLLSSAFLAPPASACDPAAWSFEQLSEQADGILYGEITNTEENGRRAALKVYRYIGSSAAPKMVHLPATKSSRISAEDSCPDFSTKFMEGRAYVVFLGKSGPPPSLLHSDWITALPVEAGQVSVNMHGHKAQVNKLLQEYGKARGIHVQTPGRHSPIWDSEAPPVWLYTAALLILVMVATFLFYRKQRRMR